MGTINRGKILIAMLAAAFSASSMGAGAPPESVVAPPRIGVMAERPVEETEGDTIEVRNFHLSTELESESARRFAASAEALANRIYFGFASKGAPALRLPLDQFPENKANVVPVASVQMTIGQIQLVADRLTEFYRREGYFVAKVYVPVQEVTQGAVQLIVQEGVVGAVRVNADPNVTYPTDLVTLSAQNLIGKPVTDKTAQNAVLYAKDLAGISTSATFEPGAKPGETNLVYLLKPGKSFSANLVTDNYGSQSNGEYRVRGDFVFVNPTRSGDQLALSLLGAFDPQNTVLGSAEYRLPIGVPGASLLLNYSRNQFKVNEAQFSQLELTGNSSSFGVGGDWNFLRSRAADASAQLLYTHKETDVDINAANSSLSLIKDKINMVTAQFSANNTDFARKGINYYILGAKAGQVKSFAPSALSPRFAAIYGRYIRYQLLPHNQEVLLQVAGQYSNQTLSSIEQFSIGGPENVRAYGVSEQLRDSGVFTSAEWRVYAPGFYAKPGPFHHNWGEMLSFSAFYDYASGKYSENLASNATNGSALSGVGLGANFIVPGLFRFRFTASTPLTTDYVASQDDDVRLFGEFTLTF